MMAATILAVMVGVSTFIVSQAAQDASSAAHEAEKAVREAKQDVIDHRNASERRLTEVTGFIECSLLVLPEERTLDNLEKCARQAGINPDD